MTFPPEYPKQDVSFGIITSSGKVTLTFDNPQRALEHVSRARLNMRIVKITTIIEEIDHAGTTHSPA